MMRDSLRHVCYSSRHKASGRFYANNAVNMRDPFERGREKLVADIICQQLAIFSHGNIRGSLATVCFMNV